MAFASVVLGSDAAAGAPAGPPGVEARQAEKGPAAETVLIGLQVDRISEVNDGAKSFAAEFDLWLRYRGVFDPNDLLLLDTLKPVPLDHPEEATDRDGEHFRLYHLNADFRFKTDRKDLAQNVRRLAVQLGRRGSPAGHVRLLPDVEGMSLGPAGASWDKTLRDDEVLAGVAGWELQSGELRFGPPGESQGIGRRPPPAMTAAIIVRRVVVSPKAIVAALISPKLGADFAVGSLAVVAALFAVTWSRPARRLPGRVILLIRLLLTTVGFDFFEAWAMTAATDRWPIDSCRSLSVLFECLWWLVPAVWCSTLLPGVVWEPMSRRTGHPVPSITRTIVGLSVYGFSIIMAMHFVFEQPLGAIWAASGVMGIILGFALQGLILDAFAGLMLNIEQPFKILHWVRLEGGDVGQQVGQVLEMNWRTTRLWTRDNDIISIPNSSVSKANITNFATPTPASRLEFTIVLDHTIPPSRARQILKQGALKAVERGKVLANPQPDAVIVASEALGIRYKVRFYANMSLVSDSGALTDAVDGVMECLAEEGIDPSTPPQQVRFARAGAVPRRRPDRDGSHRAEPSAAGEIATGPPPPSPVSASLELRRPSPISAEQVRLIQHNWSLVSPIADEAARLFYERLCHLDPGLKPLFRTDPASQRHKLIGVLSLIVKGIGDLDNLLATVQDLGLRHVNYGVKAEHYGTVGAALLWALEQGLGDQWTPEAKAAWIAAYGVLSSAMKSAAGTSSTVPQTSHAG